MKRENPIIVALDVFTRKEAEKLVNGLIEHVRIFKIGHQLFLKEGMDIIHMIQDKGAEVFLDLKFHDIPSVISSAVEVAFEEKVYMLTLHSLGGRIMLEQAVERIAALSEEGLGRKPLLLGVTILTSLDEEKLKEMGFSLPMNEQVLKLAQISEESGLDGIVCSGEEINLIRNNTEEDFIIVTPGVRPEKISSDDQERIITVEDAIKRGADYLVMGRSITESKEPRKKMGLILEKLNRL